MDKKAIIGELRERHSESLGTNLKSFDYGISKERGLICIEINGKEYSLTRQSLVDKPEGLGDELGEEIWKWIQT